MDTRHRVAILGGGFGGLYAAKALARAAVDITLVNRRNFHLFQPLLYQVATGALSPGEIASPLRSILSGQKNARVWLGEAVDLDAGGRKLILADGAVEYDTLIVAAGSGTSYFGHDEWAELAPGLKTIEEATEIRRRILVAFEEAERETEESRRREWLTFVVVGAGPTGVELAGALGEIANDSACRHDFRSIRPEEARILLLDGSGRVLPPFDAGLSAKAEEQLIRIGVRPRNKVMVVGMDERGVELQTERGREQIEARTVIWAAGVHASPFGEVLAARAGAEMEKNGQVRVEGDLTVAGHPEIFVIGDLARCMNREGEAVAGGGAGGDAARRVCRAGDRAALGGQRGASGVSLCRQRGNWR